MGYDFDRIEALIKQSGLTRKQFFAKVGISEGLFNNWKQGTVVPRENIMHRIEHTLNTLILESPNGRGLKPKRFVTDNPVYSYVLKNIDLYLHAPANKERHTAASHLRQRKYKDTAIKIAEERLITASNPEDIQLVMLLFYLDREKYMCFCLDWLSQKNINLIDVAFFRRLDAKPLSDLEEKAIGKHISSCPKYDINLLKYIHGENLELVLQSILLFSLEKGLTTKRLKTLSYNQKYLAQIQSMLHESISKNPKTYQHWIRFLDLTIAENQKLLQEKFTLFQVYWQLCKTVPEYCESAFFNVRVIQHILHNMELKPEDWYEIKLQVLHELSTSEVDDNEIVVNFLKDAYYVEPSFSESMLITVYKRTTLYTRTVLDILAGFESSFAYRELLSILLSTKDRNERFKTARSLIKWYPYKTNSILEYVITLEDKDLLKQINEDIKNQTEKVHSKSLLILPDDNSKFQLIPRSIQINELLIDLAKRINADKLYAAVGFVFSSGLRTLVPVINQITNAQGKFELIIGSLQNFRSEKNSKIDRTTVRLLNDLMVHSRLALYTFENSFYHGKFYYIGSDSKAYVIIGSSNISKTAFLDNYELDVLFEVDPNANNYFLDWYETLKAECTPIYELNEIQFSDLRWDSELDIFSEQFVRRLSHTEIRDIVNEISDEEVKHRILTWLNYKPSDCFTDLGIPALDGYTLFVYEEYSLGVFESFSRDNAYYVFNCINVEQLLLQVSQLSKTQMANINIYVGKGYHIQNKDRLQDKIAKYFARND